MVELRRQIHDGSCWLLVASLFSFIAAAQPVRRLAQTKGASWIAGGSRCDKCLPLHILAAGVPTSLRISQIRLGLPGPAHFSVAVLLDGVKGAATDGLMGIQSSDSQFFFLDG